MPIRENVTPIRHDDLTVFLIAIDIVQTRNNRQIE
jgi:hypothetical protein